jgi:hypothetical protein
MTQKHKIFELPHQQQEYDEFVSHRNRDVKHIAMSTIQIAEEVKHYSLVVWHDLEYGDVTC